MSKNSSPQPNRGELWHVDWSPARGSEQRGIRPALVVQTDLGNHSTKYPNTIVLAVTTTERGIPQHIRVEPTTENGLRRVSYIMTEQVMTISKARLVGRPLGRIEPRVMELVEEGLRRSLDLLPAKPD
jgi:mRNA interferase MazF